MSNLEVGLPHFTIIFYCLSVRFFYKVTTLSNKTILLIRYQLKLFRKTSARVVRHRTNQQEQKRFGNLFSEWVSFISFLNNFKTSKIFNYLSSGQKQIANHLACTTKHRLNVTENNSSTFLRGLLMNEGIRISD